jgi:hypothetical protein
MPLSDLIAGNMVNDIGTMIVTASDSFGNVSRDDV